MRKKKTYKTTKLDREKCLFTLKEKGKKEKKKN